MLIALDYDGTFTQDPTAWISIILFLQERGHKVICCTMRTAEEVEGMHPTLLDCVQVYNSSRRAKAEFLESLGIVPDIWIDDNPRWILTHSSDYVDPSGIPSL